MLWHFRYAIVMSVVYLGLYVCGVFGAICCGIFGAICVWYILGYMSVVYLGL